MLSPASSRIRTPFSRQNLRSIVSKSRARIPRSGVQARQFSNGKGDHQVVKSPEKKSLPVMAKGLLPMIPLVAARPAMALDLTSVTGAIVSLKPLLDTAVTTAREVVIQPVGSFLTSPAMGDLTIYLSKTVISWGVPTAALGVLLVAASKTRSEGMDDVNAETSGSAFSFLSKKKSKEPKQFLKIERINDKLESFNFSLTKATESSQQALTENKRMKFQRKYGDQLLSQLSDSKIQKLVKADEKYQKAAKKTRKSLAKISTELRVIASEKGAVLRDKSEMGMMAKMMKLRGFTKKTEKLIAAQSEALKSYTSAEQAFIQAVSSELSEEKVKEFTKMLKKTEFGLMEGAEGLALAEKPEPKKHAFVLSFPGDVTASQVENLREEVTAVIRSANKTRGDEVVLVLNTGGGTVTGYGLAAAQLTRIKDAGLKLTICVEQVAASGGYMMACCADRLVASPFAVLGSIGVITQQPNVYERLNREGIEFLTVTAGKYKRTLTPFKKPTSEDFKKTEEDLTAIWDLFKGFVKDQRPKLDVNLVATGETWFGKDALERNLVDELKTTDDVLLEMLDEGSELYSVKYRDPKNSPLAQLLPSAGSSDLRSLFARWLLGDQAVDTLDEMRVGGRRGGGQMLYDPIAKQTLALSENEKNDIVRPPLS